MLVFLVLVIAAYIVIGVYAVQNTGMHTVTLWQSHWTLADWVPAVTAAVMVGILFLLWLMYAGLRMRLRQGSLRRRAHLQESALVDLRQENLGLLEKNARMRSEMSGMQQGLRAGIAPRELAPLS